MHQNGLLKMYVIGPRCMSSSCSYRWKLVEVLHLSSMASLHVSISIRIFSWFEFVVTSTVDWLENLVWSLMWPTVCQAGHVTFLTHSLNHWAAGNSVVKVIVCHPCYSGCKLIDNSCSSTETTCYCMFVQKSCPGVNYHHCWLMQ